MIQRRLIIYMSQQYDFDFSAALGRGGTSYLKCNWLLVKALNVLSLR